MPLGGATLLRASNCLRLFEKAVMGASVAEFLSQKRVGQRFDPILVRPADHGGELEALLFALHQISRRYYFWPLVDD